jgi:hypothetical protein
MTMGDEVRDGNVPRIVRVPAEDPQAVRDRDLDVEYDSTEEYAETLELMGGPPGATDEDLLNREVQQARAAKRRGTVTNPNAYYDGDEEDA